MNVGQYELRSYGSTDALIAGDTATEVAQAAEVANMHVRIVAGRPAGEDAIAVAREVDLAHRGMNPPGAARAGDPGEHFELDALAADLEAGAVIDAAADAHNPIPEPKLPDANTLKSEKLAEANNQWLAAYEASNKLLQEIDEKLVAGVSHADLTEELLQYRILREAQTTAEEKLADLGEEWAIEITELNDRLGADAAYEAHAAEYDAKHGPNEDPPEASAEPAKPKPGQGPGDTGAEAEIPDVHDIAPDMNASPHGTPGNPSAQSRADAMAFAQAQLGGGTSIEEVAAQAATMPRGALTPTQIASMAFPHAHAATERNATLPAMRAKGRARVAGKTLRRGRR